MKTHAKAIAARRQTEAFIREDRVIVDILRATKTTTAGGGKVLGAKTSIAKLQEMRLVPASSRHGQVANTEQGTVEAADHVLVGTWNADVKKDDEFEVNGQWYRVVSVDTDRETRTSAGVVEHGQAG